jgi:hypothetical protein
VATSGSGLGGLSAQISGRPSVQFRMYGYSGGSTGTWRLDDVTFADY